MDERETAAKKSRHEESQSAVQLQREVNRLREDGLRKLKERELEFKQKQAETNAQVQHVIAAGKTIVYNFYNLIAVYWSNQLPLLTR